MKLTSGKKDPLDLPLLGNVQNIALASREAICFWLRVLRCMTSAHKKEGYKIGCLQTLHKYRVTIQVVQNLLLAFI